MNCKRIVKIIESLPDRPLSKDDREMLESHIKVCKRCSALLEGMNIYTKTISSLEHHKPPEGQRESTWKRIAADRQAPVHNANKTRLLLPAIAVAAAIIALLMLIPRISFNARSSIETSFMEGIEKGGKGPPRTKKYTPGTDPRADRISQLAMSTGAHIKTVFKGPDNGVPDGLRLVLDTARYTQFMNLYNALGGPDSISQLPENHRWNHVMINIWFPGRVYLTGDFNNSGKDDFAFIETRGKRPGWSGWMSSTGDGEFSAVRPLVVSSKKILSKLDVSVAISDDFNRDGFDDILIIAGKRGNDYSLRLLINLSGSGFGKPVTIESPFTQIGGDITLLQSGDFNGDRFADLAIPFVDNDDTIKWHIAYNLQGKGFSEPSPYSTPLRVLPGCDRYTYLLGDFNGDGLSDTGVYWQSGERSATWSLSINTGNSMGGPEIMARFPRGILAFQGEYFPMVSDFNGDGFDDLMVKMGSRDNYSEWYMMKNQGDSTFINQGFTAKEW